MRLVLSAWRRRRGLSRTCPPLLLHDECSKQLSTGGLTTRGHMGHAHHHHHSPPGVVDRGKAGENIIKIGLLADSALALLKAGAGYVSGSTALVADAAHSFSDIVLSAVALLSLKAAQAPRDKEHPYGHGKFETVGALGISGMLLLTGGGIGWHAFEVLQALTPNVHLLDVGSWSLLTEDIAQSGSHHHNHKDDDDHGHGLFGHSHELDNQHMDLALSAAVTSIGVKEGLYWATKRIGEVQGSQLLKANAWHHRSDAISSIVALVGVGGAMVGIRWLDPVAGLVVSGMIVKAGLETGYHSFQELVDKGVSEAVLSPIRDTVLKVEGVEDCHDLRGRRAGSNLYIDAHIEVDPWLSVSAAHNIGEAVRHQIHESHPEVAESYVHIDPAKNWEVEDIDDSKNRQQSSHNSRASNGNSRLHPAVEKDIRDVLASMYKDVTVGHVTCHFLRGKVGAEVEVSLNPDLLIRDALRLAKDMERDIVATVPDVTSVKMQLRLKD